MTLYADSSAVMKLFIDEHDSDAAAALIRSDPVLVMSRLTEVEVRRNLSIHLAGTPLDAARRRLSDLLDAAALVALDATVCESASRIAEQTLCRSLDAIHLAAALRAGPTTTLLTFDHRQAAAARTVDLTVVGC